MKIVLGIFAFIICAVVSFVGSYAWDLYEKSGITALDAYEDSQTVPPAKVASTPAPVKEIKQTNTEVAKENSAPRELTPERKIEAPIKPQTPIQEPITPKESTLATQSSAPVKENLSVPEKISEPEVLKSVSQTEQPKRTTRTASDLSDSDANLENSLNRLFDDSPKSSSSKPAAKPAETSSKSQKASASEPDDALFNALNRLLQ